MDAGTYFCGWGAGAATMGCLAALMQGDYLVASLMFVIVTLATAVGVLIPK